MLVFIIVVVVEFCFVFLFVFVFRIFLHSSVVMCLFDAISCVLYFLFGGRGGYTAIPFWVV